MLCGTPVVVSDLPGVRQPVRRTGMGEVVPVGDAAALASALERVLGRRAEYERPREAIASVYDLARTVDAYEELFARLRARLPAPERAVADAERP